MHLWDEGDVEDGLGHAVEEYDGQGPVKVVSVLGQGGGGQCEDCGEGAEAGQEHQGDQAQLQGDRLEEPGRGGVEGGCLLSSKLTCHPHAW